MVIKNELNTLLRKKNMLIKLEKLIIMKYVRQLKVNFERLLTNII